jgi:hypothetical protein
VYPNFSQGCTTPSARAEVVIHRRKKIAESVFVLSARVLRHLRSDYFFLGAAAFFLGAGTAFLTGVRPPIRVSASVALNGNWRAEV